MGVWMVCGAAGEHLAGLWAACEGRAPEPPTLSPLSPKGEAAAQAGAAVAQAIKSLLLGVQGKVRVSHCQRVFRRVAGARRRDEGMLLPAQPNLLCPFWGGVSTMSAACPRGAFGQGICAVCGAPSPSGHG